MNNTRKFLTVLILLFITTYGYSQVAFGLRAGLNSATVSGDVDFAEKKNLLGYNFAATLEVPLLKFISVQPEFQVTRKGYITEGELFGIDYSRKVAVTNFDIPVLIKVNFGKGTSQGYFIGGPTLEIAVSGEVTNITEGNSNTNKIDADDLSSETIGYQVGGGFQFESFNRNWVVIDLRYAASLRDNYDLNDDEMNSNQGLLLTVGLKF